MNKCEDQKKIAQRLNLLYQERLACLTEFMDELKKQKKFDYAQILLLTKDKLNEMKLDITGGAIIGLKNNQLSFFAGEKIDDYNDHWKHLPDSIKTQIYNELATKVTKDTQIYNYENNAPSVILSEPKTIAFSISHLCQNPDDEDLFMLLYRDVLEKPLLSHELQFIIITSKIIGWHINFELTYEVLLFHFNKSFRKKLTS
jgi:hypothetical protein